MHSITIVEEQDELEHSSSGGSIPESSDTEFNKLLALRSKQIEICVDRSSSIGKSSAQSSPKQIDSSSKSHTRRAVTTNLDNSNKIIIETQTEEHKSRSNSSLTESIFEDCELVDD